MITLWVGDFRLKQIQNIVTSEKSTANSYFLLEDTADCTWFSDNIIKQIAKFNLTKACIVIALGFTDCLYSCCLNNFDITTTVDRYKASIRNLKDSYPGCDFYFCSVNPIKDDYYFAQGLIKQNILLDRIKSFNSKMKDGAGFTFIDSHKYLTDIKFTMRDNVYFTSQTCNALYDYIKTEISKNSVGFKFNASKDNICTANSYNISVEDMQPNARYIYQYLKNEGWTLNAIAGVLGNMHVESKMSPWIWQGVIEGSIIKEDRTQVLNMAVLGYSEPGYGLVQWTPYSKYTDWCAANDLAYWDIDSQLYRICWEVANNQQWQVRADKGYNITFKNFVKSTEDPYWLAGAWAFCYERPASSTGTADEQENLKNERGNYATYWYNYLSNFNFEAIKSEPVIASTVPQPSTKIKSVVTGDLIKPISLYIK